MKKIILGFIFLLIVNQSFAEQVSVVEVSGNKRIAKETIMVFGGIKIGSDYSDRDINNILKELYKTNFFNSVKIELKNSKLSIFVEENPIIQNIQILGVKKVKIQEAILENVSLKPKTAYVKNTLSKDLDLIKNLLKSNGYYFVDVKSSLLENSNNTIDIIYEIELGDKALINNIVFLGDKVFKDRKLRNIITSEEAKFWKFLSSKKYLDKKRIDLDIRLLKSFYMNNGFYKARIEHASANLTDNNMFSLRYNINAGQKFTFNKLKLVLPINYDSKNFDTINALLADLEGEEYSFIKLEKILDEIDKIALTDQYEFINAQVEEQVIGNNKVDLSFIVSETKKFYVERIDIIGNNITREEVIRNEFIVDEGDPFNEILHNKSINNLKAKNLFAKVVSKITEGSDSSSKLIEIEVEEKATGEISLGAGFGTSGGTLGFAVSENNFRGKGIKLRTNLSLSKEKVTGLFSIVNPNFNYSGNTVNTTLESSNINKLTKNGYETDKQGIVFGTSFEQYDDFYFSPSISAYFESLKTTSKASKALSKQSGDYFDTSFKYSFDLDKRNQKFNANGGYRSTFTQHLPLVSENYSVLNSYQISTYHNILDRSIGEISFLVKNITALENDVRISNRLTMPNNKLRGFEKGKVGPVDKGDYVGGNYLTALNFSATLPNLLPGLQNVDFGMFFDAANVWGVDYDSTVDDSNKIRSSIGIGVNWFTPVGPLNFSLAEVITKASTDKVESFRFNLGTTF